MPPSRKPAPGKVGAKLKMTASELRSLLENPTPRGKRVPAPRPAEKEPTRPPSRTHKGATERPQPLSTTQPAPRTTPRTEDFGQPALPSAPPTMAVSLQPPGGLFSALVPVVVSVYARCMDGWEPQDKFLADALATQGLSRASRGVVVKTLQGMTRLHGRLLGGLGRLLEPDVQVDEPAERLSSLELHLRARLMTAAWARCVEHKSSHDAASLVGIHEPRILAALDKLPQVLHDGERVLQRALEGIIPLDVSRAAEALSLPTWLTTLWSEQLGWPTTVKLGRSLLEAPPLTLRVNPHRIHREQALELLAHRHGLEATRTPYSPFGLILPARIPLDDLSLYRDGLVEVQDEGSQLAALASAAAPGLKVLDLCTGAGGKILLIGSLQRLNGTPGETFACDPHPGRLRELRRRLSRAALTHVQVRQTDALDPHALTDLRGRMDRVMVDAPCSGLGALRRNPEARWRLTPSDLARFAPLQEKLLEKAAQLVKPGGRVLYVTCTLNRSENEAVLERILQQGLLRPAPLCQALGRLSKSLALDPEQNKLTLFPHLHSTDGFFLGLLERPR